ncbi:3'-5' exoribonuclease [Escherichia coli]|nr:3'-5' exoribonuclease [Escherichia coli]
MNNLMIDLETMGKNKDAPIVSIGAVFFTPEIGDIGQEFYTVVSLENAIEYIRSIAFHIDEGDYHGKHIAYFMRQALAWLEGYSCRDDSQGKSDNSPLPRYQVIELTMLVKQLVSQLKKAKPDCKLPDRAMDYLLRNGLVSAEGVLR